MIEQNEDPNEIPIEKFDELMEPYLQHNIVACVWYSEVAIECDDPPHIVEQKANVIRQFLKTKLN